MGTVAAAHLDLLHGPLGHLGQELQHLELVVAVGAAFASRLRDRALLVRHDLISDLLGVHRQQLVLLLVLPAGTALAGLALHVAFCKLRPEARARSSTAATCQGSIQPAAGTTDPCCCGLALVRRDIGRIAEWPCIDCGEQALSTTGMGVPGTVACSVVLGQ